MKRKLMALALAGACIVSTTPMAQAADLADVPGSWCEKYVVDLMNRGIVGGYDDGTYKAGNPVTRGAIAKMVMLSMQDAGSMVSEYTKGNPFKDMKGNWAEKYVVPLADLGILVPEEYGGRFSAGTSMTRLEVAKMLVRTYLYAHSDESLPTNVSLDFTDASEISASDAPYVAMAVEKGMINGYEDGSFKPSASITRGTAAAMISRFLGKVGKITDTVMGEGGENRVDGQIEDVASPVSDIKNVDWVIKPSVKIDYQGRAARRFSSVSPDGIACYWTSDNGKPTFVDKQGKTYQFKQADVMGPFVGGYARARDLSTGLEGYIDINGNWGLKPEYDSVSDPIFWHLKDGSIVWEGSAKKNEKWDFFNHDLSKVPFIPKEKLDYESTDTGNLMWRDEPIVKGSGKVLGNNPTKSGLWVYSDMLGEGTRRQPYYGICDNDGNIIVNATAQASFNDSVHSGYYHGTAYDDCLLFDHQSSINMDVITDIYDDSGKLIFTYASSSEAADEYGLPQRFVGDYGQGLFVASDVRKSGFDESHPLVGYMDRTGKMVIPAVFDKAVPFSNGYAWVEYQGLWGMIKLPQF